MSDLEMSMYLECDVLLVEFDWISFLAASGVRVCGIEKVCGNLEGGE